MLTIPEVVLVCFQQHFTNSWEPKSLRFSLSPGILREASEGGREGGREEHVAGVGQPLRAYGSFVKWEDDRK